MELLNPQHALLVSLVKSLDDIDENWRNYEGLIIPGSWPGQDDEKFIQEAIPKIKEAKEARRPFLGLCLGLQALGISEGGRIVEMENQRQGIYKVRGWWGETFESHWHKYKVEGEFPEYEVWETEGIIEVVRHKTHPFFVGTQFHGEYQSSKKNPHPVLKEFLEKCLIATMQKASEI